MDAAPLPLPIGQRIARGLCRHLRDLDFATLTEFVPSRGLRVDVMALGPKGQIWIIECKSSRADFQSDHKWQGYLPWCDAFFWAVAPDFPCEILPDDCGLFYADDYDAQMIRAAPPMPLAAARRRALTLQFARQAALRAQMARDPSGFSAV